jgi:hypothetical protein
VNIHEGCAQVIGINEICRGFPREDITEDAGHNRLQK